jgi:hypothetical protein
LLHFKEDAAQKYLIWIRQAFRGSQAVQVQRLKRLKTHFGCNLAFITYAPLRCMKGRIAEGTLRPRHDPLSLAFMVLKKHLFEKDYPLSHCMARPMQISITAVFTAKKALVTPGFIRKGEISEARPQELYT